MRALDVALLWHMHQPSYRNPSTDVYELPWVRLRAAKDYVHMLEVLADYPDVRVTINWTPVLLAQLDDYAAGRARDRWLELAVRRRRSPSEQRFMLQQ
ncbi:MAG: glycoside hydrolase, partial [Chloroflexi bacterium]|nr:glycoside hydrolase [Chloroflexota bacterium]